VRVRPLSPTGDYTIGVPFLVNTPSAVAQCIRTRLQLWLGEWFADTTQGTPYLTGVLAERYGKNPDSVIKQRILGTQGVTSIVAYSSTFDPGSRLFTVNAQVLTQYSTTPISITQPLVSPPQGA
jgi:hypothetical protein